MKSLTLKKLKIFFTACFAFFAIGASALLINPASQRAFAEEEPINKTLLSTQYQTNGASVRVFNNQKKADGTGRELVETSKKGIRFHVETGAGYEIAAGIPLVDVTKTNEKNGSYKLAEGYKTYTLILPTRLLNGELTPTTDKVMAIDTTEYWFTDANNNWESVAYIYNVPENMYTDEFSYRGVICKADGKTETVIAETEVATRSLAYVAKMAYLDTINENDNYWGSKELDETAAPLIKAFVPTYTITYTDAQGNALCDKPEEVLWGDAPTQAPVGEHDTWYDTTASEEIDVSQAMNFTENREFTLVTTNSNEFVLTGVAAHSHNNGYNGVKIYATLPADKFSDNTELDIKAVKITHNGSGTFTGLAGVWTMQDGNDMRLFFGFKEGTALSNGDTLTLSADSVFYANGLMYKLTENYTIDYNGIDYGMFLGYLNNGHIKAIYNTAEDSDWNGTIDEFTIRVEFYEDIMITDSYAFVHSDFATPVYIQCGENKNLRHPISGGRYYWVEDKYQPDGYTKILELISPDTDEHRNKAYGKHKSDELRGLAGTKLVQNGGYYIFEDEMYAYFLPTSQEDENGVVEGVWTVGEETGACGFEEFAKTGDYVASDNEVRCTTATRWFDTGEGVAMLTIENMSDVAKNAVYHTSVNGTVTPITKIFYHGYEDKATEEIYKILGLRGIPTPQAGDTVTIVGGTRLWYKQGYYTVGDLVGEKRTKDVVFCYNGEHWFPGYDANNNSTIYNADVGGIYTEPNNGGEIRLWLWGSGTDRQVLNANLEGKMVIDPRTPALYNGAEISGINTAHYYGSGNDLVSFITGITAAREGDYFHIPANSVWWTTFYGASDPINRAVIFHETVDATYNGSAWEKGNKQATFDYVNGNFSVSGIEKGYLYQGKAYTFSVTPNSGYVISKVLVNGVTQSLNANGQYVFTAQKANSLEVETVKGYNVTFNVGNGAIVKTAVNESAITSGTVKPVAEGDSLRFTITVNKGYKLVSVTGATLNSDGSYTVSPTANTSVTVSTEIDTNLLTDISDTLTIENWTDQNGADFKWFLIRPNSTEYMIAATEMQGKYWNDQAVEIKGYNYDVDLMDYILINGTSVRELVTQNTSDNKYVGTTFPFTLGGVYAPITVETGAGNTVGLWMKVMTGYASSYTVTIKAGFIFVGANGTNYYVSEDVVYSFDGTNLIKVLNNRQVDATEMIGIENRMGWDNPPTDHLYLALTCTGGTNGWLNVSSESGLAGYWNDHPEKANTNNGVDIMEYIYINDTSVRDIVMANKNGQTDYIGTTNPFNAGSWYAPITIETTTGSGIFFRIMNEFVNNLDKNFTITIKAGFTIIDEHNHQLIISRDIKYTYNNGTLTKN